MQSKEDQHQFILHFYFIIGITLIDIPYWWNYSLEDLSATIHKYRPDIIAIPPPKGKPISLTPPHSISSKNFHPRNKKYIPGGEGEDEGEETMMGGNRGEEEDTFEESNRNSKNLREGREVVVPQLMVAGDWNSSIDISQW